MKALSRKVFTFFTWVFVATNTLLVWLAILLLSPFDQNQRVTHHIANFWGKSILKANPFWKVHVKGTEHIRKNTAYVLVANHNSLADIVCLYCLGRHYKWIAKESLFKIPFFGWTMSLLKYIPLRRGEHGSIQSSYALAQQWLAKKVSVLFFPEGTRSRTGQIGPFKNGAFKLAIKTKRPIIPIVLSGASDLVKRGQGAISTNANIFVKVLQKIDTSDYHENDFGRLRDHIHSLMAETLKTISD